MLKNKLRLSRLGIAVVLSIITIFSLGKGTVQAAPFNCTPGFYQIIAGQLKLLDPETGSYTNVGPTSPDMPNAAGYNIEDNYIYAMGGLSLQSHLLRYDSDGTFTDLGIPAGLPVNAYIAGDFDNSGNLWVREFGVSNQIWRIDVSAGTATSLTLSSTLFVSELVHINNTLYGLAGPTLVVIDLNTAVVTAYNVTGLIGDVPALSAMGAGWAAADGRLYFSRNTTGMIYEIKDYTTNTPYSISVVQGEIPTSNDGASCPYAVTPIADISASDDTKTVVQNSILEVSAENGVLANVTGYGVTVGSYTQPSYGTVVINPDGSYTYIPNHGYVGEDSFTYTVIDSLGNTATATIAIRVTPLIITINSGSPTLASTGMVQLPSLYMAIGFTVTGLLTWLFVFWRSS